MRVNTISPAELNLLSQRNGESVLLDVRTRAEYARVHATGARSMPLDQLDIQRVASECRNPDGSIYVICHSGARSATACQRLLDAGIEHVFSVEGGTVAWEKMGLPVVRGRGVISMDRQVRIIAGSLVLTGCLLAWLVSPGFLALSAFIGAGLVFAGITDICGMAILLGKMPWNC